MLAVASCGPDGHHARVEGRIDGINQAKVLAFAEDALPGDAQGRVDTIEVRRGKFSYERAVSAPTALTLLYPNYSTTTLVIAPGNKARVKGDANRLGEIEISGNDDNRLLTEFRRHTHGKRPAELQREAATFIRSHAATLAAQVLFREIFASAEVISDNPTASLLDALCKAQPKDSTLKAWKERLTPVFATSVGKRLPEFTAKDIDGKKVASADFAGKPLMIVFGAQWDPSFYNIKRQMRRLDEALPAGRLTMLFVSCDVESAPLKGAIAYEPLPGRILFDGKGLDTPLIRTLGMRSLGSMLLVGRDGTIIARDIAANDWAEKVPPLL